MSGISILLPWPPSTNDLWRAVKRRNIMSARYRDWVSDAECDLSAQPHRLVEGPVAIRLELCPPTNRAYDPDNFVKAVLDFLRGKAVIEGDSNRTVRKLTVECSEGFNGVWAHIDPHP